MTSTSDSVPAGQRVPVVFDSNIFVYALGTDQADPRCEIARNLLRHGVVQDGAVTEQVIGEVFTVLRRKSKLSSQEIWDRIDDLRRAMRVLMAADDLSEVTARIVLTSGLSWWDARIVATCAATGISVLLTEDMQDGRVFRTAETGGVPVEIINPFAADNRARLEALGL